MTNLDAQYSASRVNNSQGCVVLFTGLCASGKTTLARHVFGRLADRGCAVELLDGDEVRKHLAGDLGFAREERIESVRRVAFVANLLASHGIVVLVAVIAPYRSLRDDVRAMSKQYLEVFVNAPLDVCEKRDPKGLYQRARSGSLRNFTGIDDVYEPPESPNVECLTDREDVGACVEKILRTIEAALGWSFLCA